MSRLRPAKLHVSFRSGATPQGPAAPRRYTLTHSDRTGDLFLTIGREYDEAQISGFYTRLMRDEVLAEWLVDDIGPSLHVYCHVSGGLAIGSARWRYSIFRHELPLVLECFWYGERALFQQHPSLEQAPIIVHFRSTRSRYRRIEEWGALSDYRVTAKH